MRRNFMTASSHDRSAPWRCSVAAVRSGRAVSVGIEISRLPTKGQRVVIALAPLADETGLAMHKQANRCALLAPAEADRRAAFTLIGQIGWLAPFQGFGEGADLGKLCRGFDISAPAGRSDARALQQGRPRDWQPHLVAGRVIRRVSPKRSPFLRRFARLPMKRPSRIRF